MTTYTIQKDGKSIKVKVEYTGCRCEVKVDTVKRALETIRRWNAQDTEEEG